MKTANSTTLIRKACSGLSAVALGAVMVVWNLASPAHAQGDWQAEWDRVKAAARAEGKVVVGIPPNPQLRRGLEEAMKEKFGIQIELTLSLGARSARRIADEFKAGIRYFDVVILSVATITPSLRGLGAIDGLEQHWILPEVKDASNWWGGHLWGDKDNKFVYVQSAYVLDNVWHNERLVKADELKSWNDLLHPKLKGKIGLFDPRVGGAGIGVWGFIWRNMGEDYLRKLHAQNLVLGDRRTIVDQLAKGRLAVTIGPTYYTFQQFVKAGLPVAPLETMKEGGFVSTGNGGPVMMKEPPHPNAAKVFVNWLLSREGQELYTKLHGQATRRLDVDTTWMREIGVRAAKDSITIDEFRRLESQSEKGETEIRQPALEFGRTLFD